jgi:hypothetical protein
MAQGKTVYIKSESGRVESFDQFRAKLRNLSTPDKMRFKELRSLLMKEAQPLVTKARQEAYAGSQEQAKAGQKQRSKMGASFYNLYSSIRAYPNKGTEKVYVVVGLRGSYKKGAYYAPWQLFGGTQKGFRAKEFIDKAVDATDVPAKAQKRIAKFVAKRIKENLR